MDAMSAYPYSSMNLDRPWLIISNTSGPSVPTAVPTWNADAPAMMYSAASLQSDMPPTPTIGMSSAVRRSYTARMPTGLIPGPERPPNLLLRTGLANSGCMTMALRVLMATTASPPASCTAMPMSVRIWVFGVSFDHTGIRTASFTADTMLFTRAGSVPTSIPKPLA